ncbi:flavodoxin [Oceanobacillus luteolus]|uniref:Flavodoxin n=1 Tax=Oceanobacillus luteolus TaxID=1274358 RepID=A0ABW4HNX3_9BACI
MANVLILYISMTGNTEMMAEAIAGYLEYKDHLVDIKTFDFDPIDVEELLDYDVVFIGTHSSDDGEIPFEAEDFYEELDEADIGGRVFGVFGSGDTAYDEFCLSVDLMGDKLVHLGANVVPERMKVDLTPSNEDIERIEQFAESALQMVNK